MHARMCHMAYMCACAIWPYVCASCSCTHGAHDTCLCRHAGSLLLWLRILFFCRVASHDRCSWVLEWEGFDAQHKPGWLHPAVYVLTAACYSYDMERNRQSSGVVAAVKTLQAWASKWRGEVSRLASPMRSFYLNLLSKLQTSVLG